MSTAATVKAEQAAHDAENETGFDNVAPIDGTTAGPDADKGKLFEVPRVAVTIDESDPNVLSISFSGTIKIDRTKDIEFYNSLKHGKTKELTVEAHVAGASRSHRRDKEGDVQAIAETKSLVVHSVVGIEKTEAA